MKLVILDSYAVSIGDLDWTPLRGLIDEIDEYARTADSEAYERLKDADFAICNKCIFDEALFERLPRLKWVGKIATGTDNIDLAAARRHGVAVANVPGYSSHSVAQLVFALILSVCQCPERHSAAVRAGHWQLSVPPQFNILPQREIYGKTLGLLGFGEIARETAKIANAFGMRVLCCTRTPQTHDYVEFIPLADMLSQSDFISLHCPLTDETRGIISDKELNCCRNGAVLINTARGALVDEQAVVNALRSEKLYFYCADVFVHEPILPDNKLLLEKNVILTPHIAWSTAEALASLSVEVCDNLKAYLKGIRRNIVN